MCTKFGVDSSGRFSFRVWTDKVTDVNDHPTHAVATASIGYKALTSSFHFSVLE